jgi:5-hydroxyisourate hydrolase
MSAGLTTHVLDTARGRPAEGIAIELWREGELLVSTVTNADGRTDAPLVEAGALLEGTYELRFVVGPYFAALAGDGPPVDDPPFLDVVPVVFGVADAEAHFHVPLLVTPWSYSTYRGS